MPVKDNKNSAATATTAPADTAPAQPADEQPTAAPKGPVVVRRYRATGRADELGIHSIGHGYIVVEALADGSFRIAPDQDAPLFEQEA